MIQIIAAIDRNSGIGYHGDMLFWIKEDLKHFKETTTGGTVIMGRKTYDSLPKGALPNRRNIVITHNVNFSAPNVEVFNSVEDALAATLPDEMVYIIGGAMIYEETINYADRLIITHIDAAADNVDAYFPTIDPKSWKAISNNKQVSEKDGIGFDVTTYHRHKADHVWLKRISKDKDEELHKFMEDLMVESFPEIEYRSFEDLESYSETLPEFHNTIIMDSNKPVGFITFWDLGEFYYLEHLAILPDIRNRGYGHKVLSLIKRTLQKPIVFEVEIPEGEMAIRRVNLYKRHGFKLLGEDYEQPPYRKGFDFLPMKVMIGRQGKPMPKFDDIVERIHTVVYRKGELYL